VGWNDFATVPILANDGHGSIKLIHVFALGLGNIGAKLLNEARSSTSQEVPAWPAQPSTARSCTATEELLNGEIFYTLRGAKIVIESWRRDYKRRR
jgi:hypothetical protein